MAFNVIISSFTRSYSHFLQVSYKFKLIVKELALQLANASANSLSLFISGKPEVSEVSLPS